MGAKFTVVVGFCIAIFTAHKGSLGQGNVFTPVCHSVHRGEGSLPTPLPPMQTPLDADPPRLGRPLLGCRPPWGWEDSPLELGNPPGCRFPLPGLGSPPGCRPLPVLGRPPSSPRYSQQAGGTHPTGMHTCFFVPFHHLIIT